jgi:hypothetical protein
MDSIVTTISELRNDETGNRYELWKRGNAYRLRTWHVTPSGVTQAGHSILLSEDELEHLAEDIHRHLFTVNTTDIKSLLCYTHDRPAVGCRTLKSENCDLGEVMA